MYTQKITIIFDHFKSQNCSWPDSKLGLKNKSGQTFCFRQVYFTKSCQQIWVSENQPFYHLYITSEVKQYNLSYRPLTDCNISQFFKTNCTQLIFRTIHRGLLTERCSRVFEWTLIELRFNIIKNLLRLFLFHLMVL